MVLFSSEFYNIFLIYEQIIIFMKYQRTLLIDLFQKIIGLYDLLEYKKLKLYD